MFRDAIRAVEDFSEHRDAPSFHDAAKAGLEMLQAIVVFALFSPNPKLALWQASCGLGLPVCDGMTMAQIADKLGFTRAALSKGAREFQRANGLPQSEYMRNSASSCAVARTRQLAESDCNGCGHSFTGQRCQCGQPRQRQLS